jgi:hypothetical protein
MHRNGYVLCGAWRQQEDGQSKMTLLIREIVLSFNPPLNSNFKARGPVWAKHLFSLIHCDLYALAARTAAEE